MPKILIIDDSPLVCQTYARSFEQQLSNIQISFADNGLQGSEMALKFKPDLIILDGNMPVMNGLETISCLKKNPTTANIPIFFVSADAYLGQEAIKLGAKYFDKNDLKNIVTAIKQWLDR